MALHAFRAPRGIDGYLSRFSAKNSIYLTATNTVLSALEATSIPVDQIKTFMDISPSKKKVLILDCCFSGAVDKIFTRGGVDDQLQLMSEGQGTCIMTASTAIQAAVEKESDEYGVFTKHIIEGIQSEMTGIKGFSGRSNANPAHPLILVIRVQTAASARFLTRNSC